MLFLEGVLGWTLVASLAAASGIAAFRWSANAGYMRLADTANHQLDLYAVSLESELSKYENLPGILEMSGEVFELLERPDDAVLAGKLNRKLLNLNVRSGSLGMMLLDAQGTVLSSSNWYEPASLIGRNLSAEAFHTKAVHDGQARTFVVGAARGAPESYFSRAIARGGRVLGVVVVRISLEAIESAWIESAAGTPNERVLVVDDNGVVIISSNPAWRYRTLRTLSAEDRVTLASTARYPAGSLEPLQWTTERELKFGTQLVRLRDKVVAASEALFISQEQDMARPGWRLITLSRVAVVQREARNTAVGAMACAALIGVLGLHLMQRRRAMLHRLATREALQRANDELELRVEERTGELRDANSALMKEVAERVRTETHLRRAQDELVEVSRLALLGKMSAAISHEINQPLTALRALSDNGVRLLKAGRLQDVERKFDAIAQLTERMGRITAQLKSFAYKRQAGPSWVRMGGAVANALELLRSRIHDEGVEVELHVQECLRVSCDGYRLEQVLVNLLGNAMDAMKDSPVRRITVTAAPVDGKVKVRVADTGTGFAQHVLDRLFEPFFTTKPPGQGLGLGLALSAGIVREFGSSLQPYNLAGGAAFEFELKMESETADA
ncbi:ATP-binding protein [Ramlibacter sp.]|uniref:sensor histidine kinase n=1 Tax=Ramlibacter sp. TaxID=1917967 RepID=UPI0017D857D2|nr:ATP-binding protein [Ramlibacter sp.]MBA2673266.1 sensor histidine kinase [Ramlibacter sp.]